MYMWKVLIDGDIVAYRSAFSAKDGGQDEAEQKAKDTINFILEKTTVFPTLGKDYEVYLTGSKNFRFDIAKTQVYKGNRKGTEKPEHLSHVRDYLISEFGAKVSVDEEADDLISIEAARQGYHACVASIDKDMLQIPCWHFNFVRNTIVKVKEFDGLVFFYKQILTGDSADNIAGLWRVGPVKAEKMLEGIKTEQGLWDAVIKAYDGNEDRVLENARLLWLRRKEGELWQSPKAR